MSEPIREILSDSAQELLPENKSAQAMPMGWHGFLVKLMLPLAAVVHALQAGVILSGKMYYTAAVRDQVYAGIPALRIADYALAACLLIAAILQIIARSKLKKLNAKGARVLCAAYALLALGQIAHGPVRFLIAGLTPLNIPAIAQALGYGALLLVNRSYYARRRGAFGKETQ